MIVSVACGLRTVVNWLRLYSQRQGDELRRNEAAYV
jgi:hypothetical protein